MSKASEYAKRHRDWQILVEKKRTDVVKFGNTAFIQIDGSLMTYQNSLKPDEALKLADWIYEHYREENQEK
jgi:hypothetical protein